MKNDTEKSNAPALAVDEGSPSLDSALRELHGATEALMEIVEGVRSQRWVGDFGGRLKDTPEWCRFYVARCAVNRAADARANMKVTNAPQSV